MAAENHPFYGEELARLNYTLDMVEMNLMNLTAHKQNIETELAGAKRKNLDIQAYMDMLVNSTIRSHMLLKEQNLEKSKEKPYFARIDFREGDKAEGEKLYLGKMCLSRDEDQKLIIVDWRAPVANMYYENQLGEASYICPDGEIQGELSLKRQFSIDAGVLKEIFDIDITTNDEFLQSYLGANAENRLKEIVSTIQTEQNRVIRAEMRPNLIVQGVAGSGKTTIALHRIAYLIYNYEKVFQPENFMIIAPNRLFLNYISEVLPELGVELVKQTTFEDFATEVIGEKFKIRDVYEKLLEFVKPETGEESNRRRKLLKKAAEFKSSLLFKEILDGYLELIEGRLLLTGDFSFKGRVFFSEREIRELYYEDYREWPFYGRIEQIKKHFAKRLKERKDELIAKMQNECNLKIERIKFRMADTEERQRLIIKTIDEKDEFARELDQFLKKGMKDYFKQIPVLSAFRYYQDFLAEKGEFETLARDKVGPELQDFLLKYTRENFKSGSIEIEDLAAILYLKVRLYGLDEKVRVKHIVIDEAQDFSVFQFYTMKKIIKDSSFTIFGDLAQGIHAYRGVRDWNELQRDVFGDGDSVLLTLEQSYRTTIEIMDAANLVLGHLPENRPAFARPVIRHGEPVKVIEKKNFMDTMDDVAGKITRLKEAGLKSIAVICKTITSCSKVFSELKERQIELSLITGKENEYRGGAVIVPIYLAKGLEFDAVIIADASRENYGENDLDIKLLYVAMTRPLHVLDIYYQGPLSPLLEEIGRI